MSNDLDKELRHLPCNRVEIAVKTDPLNMEAKLWIEDADGEIPDLVIRQRSDGPTEVMVRSQDPECPHLLFFIAPDSWQEIVDIGSSMYPPGNHPQQALVSASRKADEPLPLDDPALITIMSAVLDINDRDPVLEVRGWLDGPPSASHRAGGIELKTLSRQLSSPISDGSPVDGDADLGVAADVLKFFDASHSIREFRVTLGGAVGVYVGYQTIPDFQVNELMLPRGFLIGKRAFTGSDLVPEQISHQPRWLRQDWPPDLSGPISG